MRRAKQVFAELDAVALRSSFAEAGCAVIDFDGERVELDSEDVEISVEAEEHFAAAGDSAIVTVLSTELDDDLLDEGFYRELLHRIQNLRKETDIEYTRRIELHITGSGRTARIVEQHRSHLMAETLCTSLSESGAESAAGDSRDFEIDGERVRVVMRPV